MSYSTGGAIQEYRAGVPSLGTAASLPSDISGLQLWYKADQITGLVDADPVTTWTDLGALLKDLTQVTAGNKPSYRTNVVNSLPVVRFDGTDDRMATASFTSVPQPTTFFIVVKSNNASKDRYFDSAGRQLFGNDTSGYEMYAGSSLLTGGTRDTSWHVFTIIFNGASSRARKDGTSTITGNPGTAAITLVYLGWDGIVNTDNLSGDVAEFGMYNVALSDANHNALGSGLATKYALTWNSF